MEREREREREMKRENEREREGRKREREREGERETCWCSYPCEAGPIRSLIWRYIYQQLILTLLNYARQDPSGP